MSGWHANTAVTSRASEANVVGVLVMLNNFFHDFSVALLACALLGLAVLWRAAPETAPAAAPVIAALEKLGIRVAWASFAGIILFGVGRTAAFMDYEWFPAVGRGLVPALAVKHVFLVLLLGMMLRAALRARRDLARGRGTEAP